MTFNQFLLILRARWRIACAIFGVVVVLAMTLAMILPKKYTATASIVIDAKSDPVAGGGGLSEAVMGSYVNTQSDVVTSERVAQKVVKDLKLDKDPAFLEGWRNKTHGEGDISISLARFLLDGKRVVAAPPANSSATRQTNVIEISVKWPDAKMAAAIANSFAQNAIETNIELKVEPAKQYAKWFDQRSAALRADLELKQKRLSDFQQANGIVATDDKLDNENARLTELSTQLVAIQAQRQDSQSRQKQVNGSNEFLPEVLQSPLIASLKDALTVAEAKRTEVAGRLGKNHPDYQAAEAEVASLRARIAAETDKIVSSLGSTTQVNMRRENEVRLALEAQKKRVLELKHAHDEAAVLASDVTTAQRDMDAVSQRLALSNLESLAQQTNVVLLTTAAEPTDPSSPKFMNFLEVGIFLGLILGVGAALIFEMKDKRLREDGDLVRLLGVPVLGRIVSIKPGQAGANQDPASGSLATI
jgi:succinoglycan biosynthesis transport protein ExoP